MASPSDLTKTGSQLVLDLINTANPSMVNGAASATNVTFGAPAVLTGDPSGKNTSLQVTAVATHGYTGNVTIKYNRLAIDTDVFAVLAPSGATLVDGGTPYATVADLLAPLNAAYSINLQAGDISNGSTAISGSYPKTATITIAAGSLTYTGSLSVQITQPQVALSSAITTTTMDGLTPPA